MIVLDNIIFSLQKAGGVSTLWTNLMSNLMDKTNEVRFIEYENSTENIFRGGLKVPERYILLQKGKASKLNELFSPKVSFDRPFIFHSSYFRLCKNKNAINVSTVHDFIYEQGKPTFMQKFRIMLDYRAIRKSDAIVCISENTKKDLLKFIPDIDPEKITVIYNGVSEDFSKLSEIPYPEYKDSILYIGGRQSYKNFDFVVKTLSSADLDLVICGTPLSDREREMLERELPGRYRHVLFPSNQELNKILNSVYALAYPSSYEGFGIPVIEAQRAGCPVIALNASSIPEIIGDDRLLMNALSKEEFMKKIGLLKDIEFRNSVVALGLENAGRFSWQKMSDGYYELYMKLLHNKS